MHHNLILFLACILLPGLAQLQDQTNEPLLDEASEFLVDLNETNFDQKVLSDENERWFIMFYAPWCHECLQAMSAYKELAQSLKDQFSVGRVNCETNFDLWNKYEVQGYPTFLYFYQGKIYQFEGERTLDAWTDFVTEGYKNEEPKEKNKPTGLEEGSKPASNQGEERQENSRSDENRESSEKPRSITELNKANFNDKVLAGQDERWFVMFYSPNCSTCENSMPLFSSLPEDYTDDKVCFGRVDIAQNPSLKDRFVSNNDPSFRYFYNGDTREYEGENSIEAWKDFIKRQYDKIGAGKEDIYDRFRTGNGSISIEDKLVQDNPSLPIRRDNLPGYQNVSQSPDYNETIEKEGNYPVLTPEEKQREDNQILFQDEPKEYQNITEPDQSFEIAGENLTQYQNIPQEPAIPQNLYYNETTEQYKTLPGLEENVPEYQYNKTIPRPDENLTQDQNITQEPNLPQNIYNNETVEERRNKTTVTLEEPLRNENETMSIFGYNATDDQNGAGQNQTLPGLEENATENQYNQTIDQNATQEAAVPQDLYNNENISNETLPEFGENAPEYQHNETIPRPDENLTQDQNITQEPVVPQNLYYNQTIEQGKDNATLTTEEQLTGESQTFPGFVEKVAHYQNISQDQNLPSNQITERKENEALPGSENTQPTELQTPPNLEQGFSPIIDLTADDFDSQVLSDTNKRWLVMFYSPECPVCGTVAPLFEKLAESVKDKISLGKVNIESCSNLKDRYSIQAHPTFIYFHNGKNHRFESGEKTVEAINEFVGKIEELDKIFESDESDVSNVPEIEENPEYITELTESNFDEKVLPDRERWFIMFYSPSCPHCKKAMPTFIELAKSLQDQKDICIGRVNLDTNPGLQIRFTLNGHPTFLYFENGELRQYEGARTIQSWTEFINRGYRKSEVVEEDQPKLIEEDTTHTESNETSSREGSQNVTDVVKERPPQQAIDEQIGATLSEPAPEVPSEEPLITPEPEEGPAEFVKDLSAGDFDLDQGQRWFVMFYAPWCPHCKHAMPTLEEFAQTLDGQVNVGRVDCDANAEVLSKFSIQGYPTFIYFYNGESRRYDGERTVEQWTLFVNNDFTPTTRGNEPETPSLIDEKSPAAPEITEERADYLMDLTEGDFDSRVFSNDNSRWFVLFYAPWCPHCQHAMPAYNELGQSLQGKISIARVNCVENQGICGRFGIQGYPTFLYFYKGETRQFEGDRTVEAWTEFVNRGYEKEEVKEEEEPKELEKEASPTTAEPEELPVPEPEAAGSVVVLNSGNFDTKVSDDQPWFIMFYTPWCPHCKHAMPAWEDFGKSMQGRLNVGIVDCQENSDLRSRFGVNGYPTFIYLYNGQRRQYEGPRTMEDWNAFIEEGYKKVEPKSIVTAVVENNYGATIGWIVFGTAMGIGLLLIIYVALSQKKTEEEPKYAHTQLEEDSYVGGTSIEIDRY